MVSRAQRIHKSVDGTDIKPLMTATLPDPLGNDYYADWEQLYAHNVTWVGRLMRAKVGNWADAEDLTSEVFLSVLRPLRISATVAEVRSYLARTARTVLAAYWHRTLASPVIADIDLLEESVPVSPREPPGASWQAQALLQRLPANYRRVLELRFLRSYSPRETAQELGLSVGNVKVIQHRALRLAAEIARDA